MRENLIGTLKNDNFKNSLDKGGNKGNYVCKSWGDHFTVALFLHNSVRKLSLCSAFPELLQCTEREKSSLLLNALYIHKLPVLHNIYLRKVLASMALVSVIQGQ